MYSEDIDILKFCITLLLVFLLVYLLVLAADSLESSPTCGQEVSCPSGCVAENSSGEVARQFLLVILVVGGSLLISSIIIWMHD